MEIGKSKPPLPSKSLAAEEGRGSETDPWNGRAR